MFPLSVLTRPARGLLTLILSRAMDAFNRLFHDPLDENTYNNNRSDRRGGQGTQ